MRHRLWILWLGLKYALVLFGTYLWLALWFERSVWAGLVQLLIVVPALWAHIEEAHATGRW